ncbi:MAG: type II/IV secretion system protein [Candidatus Kerfeldbacteria bacterium]|nr:type II/IV secretion system protein [Candidatus Kerfeldbacteria bacterium]
MIHPDRIKRVLLKHSIVTEKIADDLIAQAKQKNVNLLIFLEQQELIPEEDLYEKLASDFAVPFINLQNVTIPQPVLEILPEAIAHTHEVVVFEYNQADHSIKIATTDPDDLQTIDFLRKKTGCTVTVYFTTPASITAVVSQYHSHIEKEFALFQQPLERGNQLSASDITQNIPIIKMVDTILDYAIFQNASDVHIEPTDKNIVIRFRVDGILRDVMTLPKSIQSGLVARIKILANLKLDEHRLPQDGRLNITANAKRVAVRVSILPVYDGEKIVMRLLDESKNILTLEQLGLNTVALAVLRRHITKPHGMILATGPTGSGKTTTLYTVLSIMNTPGVNISTIEDPIEYRMNRINQSQVNPKIGFTFASGLRSLLRQDPNIIMVGEIRDDETAQIAAHAAMTGHLVLSTLHTNDAISAVFRLAEMAVPHFLIASTVNVIVAQRLVRRICSDCVQSYQLNKASIDEISQRYNLTDVLDGFKRLGEELTEDGSLEHLNFFRGGGCAKCGDTGYRGRLGLYEVFEMTEAASQAVLRQASKEELLQIAMRDGMITMAQDGFVKAKRGLTTIEEILRVAKE